MEMKHNSSCLSSFLILLNLWLDETVTQRTDNCYNVSSVLHFVIYLISMLFEKKSDSNSLMSKIHMLGGLCTVYIHKHV